MSKLPLHNAQGEHLGEYDVPDEVLTFDKGAQAMHDAVVAHQANCRKGNASTKGKSDIRGAGRKQWRQKGLGRARAGYKGSNIWRGGGVAFGPKPRDFSRKLPKKTARLAFRRAFSECVSSGQVMVLDDLTVAEPRTRLLAELLKGLPAEKGALIVLREPDRNIQLAARNLPRIEVTLARNVSTYQLLRYPCVLVTRDGMEDVMGRLSSPVRRGA